MDKLGAAGLKTLRQINVIEGPLATVNKDTKALAALSSLHKEGRVRTTRRMPCGGETS
jgi:lipopolysaccharide export system protein LptA